MSEAEKPKEKPGKRIVSKGEYAKVTATKASLVVAGKTLQVLAMLCFVIGVVAAMNWFRGGLDAFYGHKTMYFPGSWVFCMVVAIGFSFCTYVFLKLGSASVEKALNLEQVRPFTRANANLPAPDSLVRASAEPVQAQETVLLRAATQGSETPVEQLVRPAGGQEYR